MNILGTAAAVPAVASRFGNGFADPSDFADRFLDSAKADQYLTSVSAPARG